MPPRVLKKPPSVKFTVNGKPQCSRVGCHQVKNRFGSKAFLMRLNPESELTPTSTPSLPSPPASSQRSTAAAAENFMKPITNATICAVDAWGRFLVEEGGDYVLAAARTETEMANVVKAHYSSYEESLHCKPLKEQRKMKAKPLMLSFFAAFLANFYGVNLKDASTAWNSLSKEDKATKKMEVLIEAVKKSGLYLVRKSAS